MLLLQLSKQFTDDISSLRKEDKKLLSKVWELIIDIQNNPKNPLSGLGKPEALKQNMSGYYSRRITDKHRLVYKIVDGVLLLVSCYGHYDDK